MKRSALCFLLALGGCDVLLEAASEAAKEAVIEAAEQSDNSSPAAPSVTPQSVSGIDIFFTTPELVYPDKAETRAQKTFEKKVIADIDAAKKTVYAAVFEYNLESIGEALVRAKKRGADVRLALDEEHLHEKEEMAAWAEKMQDAKIPISWETTDSFSHSKYIVIDDKIAWMGSWNFTVNDTHRNNNNIIRFTVPKIVENYAKEFEQMSAGTFGRKKTSLTPNFTLTHKGVAIENYFSPQDDVLKKILPKLQGAKKSIKFLAFSYTEDKIGQAMIERKSSGAKVSGVFEKRNAEGIGSEFQILKEGGIDIWEDGNCYTMHHKFIVIDDKIVITGSYNFTKRAEEQNDENVVILEDAGIAALFTQEFDRVYKQAKNPTKCGR